jgi:hypothetical protein
MARAVAAPCRDELCEVFLRETKEGKSELALTVDE